MKTESATGGRWPAVRPITSQSAPSSLHLHTPVRFTACCSHEDVCSYLCVCVCLIITVRWIEEEEEEEVEMVEMVEKEEEGGGNCAADVGRIEQQGASSMTAVVN